MRRQQHVLGTSACVLVSVHRIDATDEIISFEKIAEESATSQARVKHGFEVSHHHKYEMKTNISDSKKQQSNMAAVISLSRSGRVDRRPRGSVYRCVGSKYWGKHIFAQCHLLERCCYI